MDLFDTPNVARMLIDMGVHTLPFVCSDTKRYIADLTDMREKKIRAAADTVFDVLKAPHARFAIYKLKRAVLTCGDIESVFILRQGIECWHNRDKKTVSADCTHIEEEHGLRAFVVFNVRYCFDKSKSMDYRVEKL